MAQKRIIIVGSTSGIGKALAIRYAEKGDKVAITGRRLELLEKIHKEFPERIIYSSFDVRSEDSRERIRQLIEQLGGLDLLIYNAGYGAVSEDLLWELDKEITDINVNGYLSIANFAFQYFTEKGSGQIAQTSSIAGLRGNGMAPAYSASKAFMSVYAEGLNMKARKLNKDIVVTDIRPGFVDTKPAQEHQRFWVASIEKAARQIVFAISKRKRVAYITRRWWMVAQIMKIVPYGFLKRVL
jgi:short-subunit dehydrogenase